MSSFYSPFTDKEDRPIDIHHLQHRHLRQLVEKEIEEGYQIEYKSDLSDSVKRKIPKIIASLANSAGGWLFIGVDEKTHQIDTLKKQPRADYNQIISQLLREHLAPLPHFDSRFLKEKGNAMGVLVIYVHEGYNPPYISDGTVYIRNGSSSEPAKSQRAELDLLYQKADKFRTDIERFCQRKLYYPMDDIECGQVVLCNIYLFNTAPKSAHHSLEKIADKLVNMKPNQYSKYMFSGDSIIFQNNKKMGRTQIGIELEVFSDYSAKAHIPLATVSNDNLSNAISSLEHITGQTNLEDYLFLDGYQAFQSFQYIIEQYFLFLHNEKVDISSFIFQLSLEDAENSILYFDSKPFFEYVQKFDIPFCCKNEIHTRAKYLLSKESNFIDLLIDFTLFFGYPPQEAVEMYLDALKIDPLRNLTFA